MTTAPMTPASGALLDAAGAADYLNMSLGWVRLKTQSGELPHVQLGRRVRYRREDLDRYISERVHLDGRRKTG